MWPYYYAGTMGLVQRDGINRLPHAMGYSRYFSTICVTLADTGWAAGVGAKRGVDLREIGEHSDLVVIWGGNPVNTQVNVMSHAMQAKRRGATFVVVDPYRTDTAAKADLHLAPRPGTDGALACAIMHVLFAEGLADWDYLRAYTDCPDEMAGPRGHADARSGRRPSPASPSRRSWASPGSTGGRRRASSAATTASAARGTVRSTCMPCPACPRSPAPGGTRAAARSTARPRSIPSTAA